MRTIAISTGMVAVMLFGVWGALLMSNWAIVAASRVPIAASIDAVEVANQPYSVLPGVLFGTLGAALALAWGRFMWAPSTEIPGWVGLTLLSAIIALGGPAYFFASFSNLNSVGDTFYDWDAEAAFAQEAPLYLVSAVAAVIAVASPLLGLLQRMSRARRLQAVGPRS